MSRDRSPELDIEAELESDPRVGANHLGVSVNHPAGTLSGVAFSYSEKWAALQAAERVYGLADQIQVALCRRPGRHQGRRGDRALLPHPYAHPQHRAG